MDMKLMFTFARNERVTNSDDYEKFRKESELPSDIEIGRSTGIIERRLSSFKSAAENIIDQHIVSLSRLNDEERTTILQQYCTAKRRELESTPWLAVLLDLELNQYHCSTPGASSPVMSKKP